jgi:nucleoid DNA-binding protein
VIKRVAHETRLTLADRRRRDRRESPVDRRLIEQTLRAGESVTFPGFGTFYQSQRQEGRVRHIRTGRTVAVPAPMVARFRVGEVLKRTVAGKRRRR